MLCFIITWQLRWRSVRSTCFCCFTPSMHLQHILQSCSKQYTVQSCTLTVSHFTEYIWIHFTLKWALNVFRNAVWMWESYKIDFSTCCQCCGWVACCSTLTICTTICTSQWRTDGSVTWTRTEGKNYWTKCVWNRQIWYNWLFYCIFTVSYNL